ncbi:MAG: replication factor C large subunit [Candidatus Wukongarchaeota archaeon]|nr:replication factor C large subunit [Candidatus Wukongarchaeota archaeon]MDO8129200.1 replication factor C large subunit [Candidatus Wukongarchaeota archaeon]
MFFLGKIEVVEIERKRSDLKLDLVYENLPWTIKYRPKSVDDIVGNRSVAEGLLSWIESWSSEMKVKEKAVLLVGPAGCGKTSSVYAVASGLGYEVKEMNASDTRNREAMETIARHSAFEGSLITGTRVKRLLLIDEVDGIHGREDSGGLSELIKIIKDSRVPIICTANDAWSPKLRSLRSYCKILKFKRLGPPSIKKALERICEREGVKITETALDEIVKNCGGDLRAAINDLEMICVGRKLVAVGDTKVLSSRDREKEIFQTLKELFSAKTLKEAVFSVKGLDMDSGMFFNWIYENAHLHAESPKELVELYDSLAMADIFWCRIHRSQNWKLLTYFYDYLTGSVWASKAARYKWKKYQFPSLISALSKSKAERRVKNQLGAKLGRAFHVSINTALKDIVPYLKEIVGNGSVERAAEFVYSLKLEEEELKILAGGKTKKILKAVEKIARERPKIRKVPEHLARKGEISKEEKSEAKGGKRKKGVKKSEKMEKKQERKRKTEKEERLTLDTFTKRKKV